MTTTRHVVDRGAVVTTIAAHIADRDAFVIVGCHLDTAALLAQRLPRIPVWTA
jgi:hypothetical protein